MNLKYVNAKESLLEALKCTSSSIVVRIKPTRNIYVGAIKPANLQTCEILI